MCVLVQRRLNPIGVGTVGPGSFVRILTRFRDVDPLTRQQCDERENGHREADRTDRRGLHGEVRWRACEIRRSTFSHCGGTGRQWDAWKQTGQRNSGLRGETKASRRCARTMKRLTTNNTVGRLTNGATTKASERATTTTTATYEWRRYRLLW